MEMRFKVTQPPQSHTVILTKMGLLEATGIFDKIHSLLTKKTVIYTLLETPLAETLGQTRLNFQIPTLKVIQG